MLYDIILSLCEKRGISIARLEKECGFGNATIRGWVASSPSIAKVQKVAEYFGMTVSDLIGETRKEWSHDTDASDPSEMS